MPRVTFASLHPSSLEPPILGPKTSSGRADKQGQLERLQPKIFSIPNIGQRILPQVCISEKLNSGNNDALTFPRRSRASGVPIFSSNLSIRVSTRLTKKEATLVTLERSLRPEASSPSK